MIEGTDISSISVNLSEVMFLGPTGQKESNSIMYYDIVGSLPINLLIHVVKHLDLEDVFRSQRVRNVQFDVHTSVFARSNVLNADSA